MRSIEDLIARVEKNHVKLSEDVARLTGRRQATTKSRKRRARTLTRWRTHTGRKVPKLSPMQQLIKSISDQTQKVLAHPRARAMAPRAAARQRAALAPAHAEPLPVMLLRCERRSSSGTSWRGMASSVACRCAFPPVLPVCVGGCGWVYECTWLSSCLRAKPQTLNPEP